ALMLAINTRILHIMIKARFLYRSTFLTVLLTIAINAVAQEIAHLSGTMQQIAEDAAWCWFSDPRAVYHKGERERIYYGYINSKGDVMISARNQTTGETETINLHPEIQIEDHNVPAILFLPDGKLLAFYTHIIMVNSLCGKVKT